MKKKTIKIIAVSLCMSFLLSGCTSKTQIVNNNNLTSNTTQSSQNNNNAVTSDNNSKENTTSSQQAITQNGSDTVSNTNSYPQTSSGTASSNIHNNNVSSTPESNPSSKDEDNTSSTVSSNIPPAPPTQAEINNKKINELYNTYGVTILTGKSADVWYNLICYTGITDENQIATWLSYLEKELKRYPTGFFKDFRNISPKVKIKLNKTLWPNTAGFASYELATDFYIGINCSETSFPSRVFNHEIMHLIERYIYLTVFDNTPLSATTSYCGGLLGTTGRNNTIYDTSVTPDKMYFISEYAKTNDREDRAEVFTDYMFRPYKHNYMTDANYPIVKKMKIIASAIRKYFPSAAKVPTGTLAWEKLITY